MKRYFTISFLVSLAILALIGIASLLLPRMRFTEEVLTTCLIAAGFNLQATLLSLFLHRGRLKILAWIGLASGGIATICLLLVMWTFRIIDGNTYELIARTAGFMSTMGWWSTFTGLIFIVPIQKNWTIWVRRCVIITLTIPAFILLWGSVDEQFLEFVIDRTIGDEFFGKLIGIDAILFASGLTTILVMSVVQRRVRHEERESIERRVHVALICPRCKSNQDLPTGHSKCTSCGLNIRIEADEPRCRCGYLLHELRSETCPECGREVPQADRWPWNDQPNPTTQSG